MILEQNSALMAKLQLMERTSDALGVSNVKLRESPNLFRLDQTKHSAPSAFAKSKLLSSPNHSRSHSVRFSDTLYRFNCNQREFSKEKTCLLTLPHAPLPSPIQAKIWKLEVFEKHP
jgi:hypothetical protein